MKPFTCKEKKHTSPSKHVLRHGVSEGIHTSVEHIKYICREENIQYVMQQLFSENLLVIHHLLIDVFLGGHIHELESRHHKAALMRSLWQV